MNGTLEIYTNREWMILSSFVHGILPTLIHNSQYHTTLGINREKKSPMAIGADGRDIFREYEVTDDGKTYPLYDSWQGIDYLKDLKQPFVNVIPIDGPITRNGGACSYGSKDIRDWMMKASDNPYCQGHLLVVNTPGGSAWAKNDFQQGIEYAHSRGLRVIDLVDGMSASAGEYLASLCDEVYVVNLNDELGCVGVMASFFTMKNGSKNQFTDETYREYYDPESVDKNKEIRDIAEEEDATLLIEELKKLGVEFRADMKKAFPNATDEHLKGKMFAAKDVMGILCDGQMLLGDAINRVFALGSGAEKPIARTAGRKMGKRLKVETAAGRAAASAAPTTTPIAQVSTTLNSINMKEKFPKIFALLGVETMECKEDGTFFNASLLETLEGKIGEMEQANADAKALAEQLTNEKNELTAKVESLTTEHTAAIEQLNAEHQKAIDTLKAEHQTKVDELNALVEEKQNAIAALEQEKADLQADVNAKAENIETLTTELNGAKAAVETAQQTLAERDQQISDLNAQIAELEQNPGEQPQAGAAPQTNGQGAQAPTVGVGQYVYDPNLSYKENMKRKDAFEQGK